MPSNSSLTTLQTDFLHAFFLVTQDFFLTGGAALIGMYGLPRITHDLDLFSAAQDAMSHTEGIVAAVSDKIGAKWTEERSAPYFRRYHVARGNEEMRVDLVHEPTPQLHPEKMSMDGVLVDPIDEIFANKICAVVGRAEPRDFWDIYQLVQRGLEMDKGLSDASLKEGGVDAESLLFVLQNIHWPTFEVASTASGLSCAKETSQYFQDLSRQLALRLLP